MLQQFLGNSRRMSDATGLHQQPHRALLMHQLHQRPREIEFADATQTPARYQTNVIGATRRRRQGERIYPGLGELVQDDGPAFLLGLGAEQMGNGRGLANPQRTGQYVYGEGWRQWNRGIHAPRVTQVRIA